MHWSGGPTEVMHGSPPRRLTGAVWQGSAVVLGLVVFSGWLWSHWR